VRKDLLGHISRVHLKEKNFVCDAKGCKKQFGTNFSLKRHRRVVHQNIRLSCKEEGCDLTFASKRNLVNHVRGVHLKERNCICEEEGCGEKFVTKVNLERHRRGVHVKERLFKCADCEKDFLRKDNLKAHIQTAHQHQVQGMSRMNTTRRSNVRATGNYEELRQQLISTDF